MTPEEFSKERMDCSFIGIIASKISARWSAALDEVEKLQAENERLKEEASGEGVLSSPTARGIAARVWRDNKMSHCIMDSKSVELMARIIDKVIKSNTPKTEEIK